MSYDNPKIRTAEERTNVPRKNVVIDCCDMCPYFDNEYWGYNETCVILNRTMEEETGFQMENGRSYIRVIPEDCPLQDSDGDVIE